MRICDSKTAATHFFSTYAGTVQGERAIGLLRLLLWSVSPVRVPSIEWALNGMATNILHGDRGGEKDPRVEKLIQVSTASYA